MDEQLPHNTACGDCVGFEMLEADGDAEPEANRSATVEESRHRSRSFSSSFQLSKAGSRVKKVAVGLFHAAKDWTGIAGLQKAYEVADQPCQVSYDEVVTEDDLACDLSSLDFVTTCKFVSERILSFEKEVYRDNQSEVEKLRKAEKILERKQVAINMLAQCNTGKSTLLNAIIGSQCLPVAISAETSMRVIIQHGNDVHEGDCVGCPQPKSCPYLEIRWKGKVLDKVFGAKHIHDKIVAVNKGVREAQESALQQELILNVNLPLLAENVPEGWTAVLIDNPGVGEVREDIKQMISEAWESSVAHIYLTSPQTKGQQTEMELFKEFHERDLLGAHSPLVIVLNKIDMVYEEGKKTTEELQREICTSVSQNIPGAKDLVLDRILPVSGKWAWLSSELRLVQHLTNSPREYTKVMKHAQYQATFLPTFTCGQGMQEIEINQMTAEDLGKQLYEASGLEQLKKRISTMVSRDCIKIWGESRFSHYKTALINCMTYFQKKTHQLEVRKNESEATYKELKEKICHIDEEKQALENLVQQRAQSTTELWHKLDNEYFKDVQGCGIVERGTKECEKELSKFKDHCRQCIKSQSGYTPRQFDKDFKDFLANMETMLQELFNFSCTFSLLQKIVQDHIHDSVVRIGFLQEKACELCQKGKPSQKVISTEEKQLQHFLKSQKPPSLAEIRTEQIDIPNVDLSFFQHLIEMIKLWWKNMFTRRPAAQTDENNDGAGDQFDQRDIPYREWSDAFEKLIEDTQQNLDQACQTYFSNIKDKTIEYFFGLYASKVTAWLNAFKSNYGAMLKQKKKHMDKVQQDLHGLRREHLTAGMYAKHFETLLDHLIATYEEFAANLSQHHLMQYETTV